MAAAEPSFTFGIEEEYHLVDLRSRDLAPASPGLHEAWAARLGSRVSPEFLRSQVEIGTEPHRSFGEARTELGALRASIAELARADGLAPIAAGTHPFARPRPENSGPTDKERYRHLARDLAGVGRRLSVSGMHVHVGIEDPELRIEIMNDVRYFLPHLLVLTTSSPFWDGENTGLKSFRLTLMRELPRTGLPGRLNGWDEYRNTVGTLTAARVIEDASKIWWDVRPSARYPTLEMRVTDVATRIEDAICAAALYVSICRMLWRFRRANLSWRTYPVVLLEENRWRAQRYGLGGSLLDLGKGQLVPYADLLEELIALVAEDAAALGCEAEIAHARTIAQRGTSADGQVQAYEAAIIAGNSPTAALTSIVDWLIAETVAGTAAAV